VAAYQRSALESLPILHNRALLVCFRLLLLSPTGLFDPVILMPPLESVGAPLFRLGDFGVAHRMVLALGI
jgi:hypothetical protein